MTTVSDIEAFIAGLEAAVKDRTSINLLLDNLKRHLETWSTTSDDASKNAVLESLRELHDVLDGIGSDAVLGLIKKQCKILIDGLDTVPAGFFPAAQLSGDDDDATHDDATLRTGCAAAAAAASSSPAKSSGKPKDEAISGVAAAAAAVPAPAPADDPASAIPVSTGTTVPAIGFFAGAAAAPAAAAPVDPMVELLDLCRNLLELAPALGFSEPTITTIKAVQVMLEAVQCNVHKVVFLSAKAAVQHLRNLGIEQDSKTKDALETLLEAVAASELRHTRNPYGFNFYNALRVTLQVLDYSPLSDDARIVLQKIADKLNALRDPLKAAAHAPCGHR